jgi:phosphatidylglycerophosphate synthase
VLVVGVLAALEIRDLVPPWALLTVAAREVAALWLRGRSARPLPATADGKVKTVLQAVAVAATLLAAATGSSDIAVAASALLTAAVALTIASGVRLIHRALQTAPDAR